MRRRGDRSWICAAALILAACSPSPLLQTATDDLDSAYASLVSGPVAAPDAPLDPTSLLRIARERGPDFIAADLQEAGARLELDERKARGLPRLSAAFRTQATLDRSGDLTRRSDAGAALNWDLAELLFYTDEDGLALAEAYLPVQAEITRMAAANRLFDAYFAYEDALLEKRALGLRIRTATCKRDAQRVELELGLTSPATVDAMDQAVSALRSQMGVLDRSIDSARRDVLYLAGVSGEARLRSGLDPTTALPPLAGDVSAAGCYAGSGHALRDSLLLQGADAALRQAELEKYGSFELGLPAQITATGGLSLDVLASIIIPLIDQNDGDRRIQAARLALLELALAVEANRRRFDTELSNILVARAAARSQRSEANASFAGTPTEEATCETEAATESARLEEQRARIAQRRADTALALICARLVESNSPGVTPPADLLTRAAPRP